MATGITYQDLTELTLTSGETYTSCSFINIGKLVANSNNDMVSCLFTDCPDIQCGFLSLTTCSSTRSVFNFNSGSSIAFTAITSIDSSFIKLANASRTVTLAGGSYTGGSVNGSYANTNSGGMVAYNEVSFEDGTSLTGDSFTCTNCSLGNTSISAANFNLNTCSSPSKVTISNSVAFNISGGAYHTLSLTGSINGGTVRPSSVKVADYQIPGTWSGLALTTATDFLVSPVPARMASCPVYGANGIDSRKHRDQTSSTSWNSVNWVTPVRNVKIINLPISKLGHNSAATGIMEMMVTDSEVTDSPRLEFTSGIYYVKNIDISGSYIYNNPQIMYMGDNVKARGCNLGNLFQADLTNSSTIMGWDFRDATWDTCSLNGIKFVNCDFRGVVFDGGEMQNCTFVNSTFRGATFNGVDTTGTDFSGADMTSSYNRYEVQLPYWSSWSGYLSSSAVSSHSYSVAPGQAAPVSVVLNGSLVGTTGLQQYDMWVLSEKRADTRILSVYMTKTYSGAPTGLITTPDTNYLDKNAIQKISITDGSAFTISAPPVEGRYYLVIKNTSNSTGTVLMEPVFPFILDSNTIMAYDFTSVPNGSSSVSDISGNGYDLSILTQTSITGNASTSGTSSAADTTGDGWLLQSGKYGVQTTADIATLVAATSLSYEIRFKLTDYKMDAVLMGVLGEVTGTTYGVELGRTSAEQIRGVLKTTASSWVSVASPSSIPLDTWVVAKTVYDRASHYLYLYLNGSLVSSSPFSGDPSFLSAIPLTIGRRAYQWISSDSTAKATISHVSVSNVSR